MQRSLRIATALAALAVAVHASGSGEPPPPPNVLLIVIDDMGTDRLGLTSLYPIGSPYTPARTPNIDALAASGVLFSNAYASPVCASTRALLLTGRHGFRTGMGSYLPLEQDDTNGLRTSEELLPETLKSIGYQTAVFGKWHLGKTCHLAVAGDSEGHQGIDRFLGTVSNFGGGYHYELWPKIDSEFPVALCPPEQFATPGMAGHATQANVENARTWIGAQSQPWFCMVSFQAVHGPLQWPGYGPRPDGPPLVNPPSVALAYLDAMVEHTDLWIGELLDGLDPNTIVFLMSDNGTQSATSGPAQKMFDPYDPAHSKGTIYEHGVRVPLVVSGPGVASGGAGTPRVSDALVSLVDIYRTVTDMVGFPTLPVSIATDSVSFAAVLGNPSSTTVRSTVFCEFFAPNNPTPTPGLDYYERSLRNNRFKLIRRWSVQVPVLKHELYDISPSADPFEQTDLIRLAGGVGNLTGDALAAYQELSAALDTYPLP